MAPIFSYYGALIHYLTTLKLHGNHIDEEEMVGCVTFTVFLISCD